MATFSREQLGHYSLTLSQPQTVIQTLTQLTEGQLTQNTLKTLLKYGSVWWQAPHRKPERIRRAKKILNANDTLHLYYHPELLQTPLPTPHCLADFEQYSVWYKPKGMLSQGSKWGDASALYRWVEMHDTQQRPAFIVHRLDKQTDGIMLLAHSKKMATQLSQLFESRQTTKRYLAWVTGDLSKIGTERIHCTQPIDGKSASSWITPLLCQTEKSLVDIEIETGRKHQIRRHLAELGHPILGDRLYENLIEEEKMPDLQLSNYYLSFTCPLQNTQQTFNLFKTDLLPSLIEREQITKLSLPPL